MTMQRKRGWLRFREPRGRELENAATIAFVIGSVIVGGVILQFFNKSEAHQEWLWYRRGYPLWAVTLLPMELELGILVGLGAIVGTFVGKNISQSTRLRMYHWNMWSMVVVAGYYGVRCARLSYRLAVYPTGTSGPALIFASLALLCFVGIFLAFVPVGSKLHALWLGVWNR